MSFGEFDKSIGGSLVNVPVMTRFQFSLLTGIPRDVLEGQIQRGYWPTVRVGKWSLINIEAVRVAASKAGEFQL